MIKIFPMWPTKGTTGNMLEAHDFGTHACALHMLKSHACEQSIIRTLILFLNNSTHFGFNTQLEIRKFELVFTFNL